MPFPHSRPRHRGILAVAVAAGLVVTPVVSAAAASAPSSPARAAVTAGATPGSECRIRFEQHLDDPGEVDIVLGGVVEATGTGCVVSEPGEFLGAMPGSPDPTPAQIQERVDALQDLADNLPCGSLFVNPFGGYVLSTFCPN